MIDRSKVEKDEFMRRGINELDVQLMYIVSNGAELYKGSDLLKALEVFEQKQQPHVSFTTYAVMNQFGKDIWIALDSLKYKSKL